MEFNSDKIKSEKTSIFSVETLIAKLLDLQMNQKPQNTLNGSIDSESSLRNDANLIDLFKSYSNITDAYLSDILGIKRNSISMIRHSRSRLGPLPRIRIARDVFNVETSEIEAALESSEALLALLQKHPRLKGLAESTAS